MTINQLPPPTRTNGSLGITKINAQPIDVEEEELDAAEYNETADWVILLRDAVAELELTTSPESAGGPYDWDNTTPAIRAQPSGAAFVITLPDETEGTNWVPGRTRMILIAPSTAHGVELVVGANINLNGGTNGVGMAPIPGSDVPISGANLGRVVWITRNGLYGYIVHSSEALLTTTSEDTAADLSPGYSWRTAKLVHVTDNARVEGCALVLDSAVTTTTDWPIGESREVAKYNTSLFGFGFVMGASDTLNGGSAGVGSGIVPGSTTVPSATTARPAVTVRRDSATGWSWK